MFFFFRLSRLILEIVNSLHKTESSIRRLRRSKNKDHSNNSSAESGTNFKNENATDDDKIFMQLKVDILSVHHNVRYFFHYYCMHLEYSNYI